MVDMLVEISEIDDLNKLSRLFSYVLGCIGTLSVRDFSTVYAIHVHFYVIEHPELL